MNPPNIVCLDETQIDLTKSIDEIIADAKGMIENASGKISDGHTAAFIHADTTHFEKFLFVFKKVSFPIGLDSTMSLFDIGKKISGKCAELEHHTFKHPTYEYHFMFLFHEDGSFEEVQYDALPESLYRGTPENSSEYEYKRELEKYIMENIPENGCLIEYFIECKKYEKPVFSAIVYRRKNLKGKSLWKKTLPL